MTTERKEKIHTLLKGIETGEPDSITVVNPDKYIQHNPQTQEGGEGLAALFKRLSRTSPRVNIVRIFSDEDFVFAHTEYEFNTSRIGFEVFRFEESQTVEHWDNIQSRKDPNFSGRTMTDGSTTIDDQASTEASRKLVQAFVTDILINRKLDLIENYINIRGYIEHNPCMSDGIASLHSVLSALTDTGNFIIQYDKSHRILADSNFVLSVCEGNSNGEHTSFYDLFRIENGLITEHWDTTEKIPPKYEWKNDNGKF